MRPTSTTLTAHTQRTPSAHHPPPGTTKAVPCAKPCPAAEGTPRCTRGGAHARRADRHHAHHHHGVEHGRLVVLHRGSACACAAAATTAAAATASLGLELHLEALAEHLTPVFALDRILGGDWVVKAHEPEALAQAGRTVLHDDLRQAVRCHQMLSATRARGAHGGAKTGVLRMHERGSPVARAAAESASGGQRVPPPWAQAGRAGCARGPGRRGCAPRCAPLLGTRQLAAQCKRARCAERARRRRRHVAVALELLLEVGVCPRRGQVIDEEVASRWPLFRRHACARVPAPAACLIDA